MYMIGNYIIMQINVIKKDILIPNSSVEITTAPILYHCHLENLT